MDATGLNDLPAGQPVQENNDMDLKPARKRIIICCDGTWQSAVSGQKTVPSNVTRLCRSLNPVGTDKDGKEWQQVVWYDSGIGTNSLALGDALEGLTGQGMETNVIEAYNFVVLNYNPGDKIMCFGFSRGAYTARTIAGLISDIGVCQQADLNRFPDLWAVYKKVKHGKRFHRSDLWFDWMWGQADEHQGAGDADHRDFVYESVPQGDWAQEGSREVDVVGVFDTVGSLGMPEVFGIKFPNSEGWHNVGLSPNIPNAFQVLALDERRNAFSPTLWYLDKKTATREQVDALVEAEKAAEREYWNILHYAINLKKTGTATDEQVNAQARKLNEAARAWNRASRKRVRYQNRLEQDPVLRQVWLPGYHINIGGGDQATLADEGDMENMANIAFAWMLDQIKDHVSVNQQVVVDEQMKSEQHIQKLSEMIQASEAKLNSPSSNALTKWSRSVADTAMDVVKAPLRLFQKSAAQKLYEIGWGTGILTDSYTMSYWANGQKRRTPGDYVTDKDDTLVDTCEFIHPVVHYRVQWCEKRNKQDPSHPKYSPVGPKFKYDRRKQIDKEGKPYFEYNIAGSKKPIPEWKLGGQGSFERRAIAGRDAYDYVDQLDQELQTGIKTIRRPTAEVMPTRAQRWMDHIKTTTASQSVHGSATDDTAKGSLCKDPEIGV
ncbi:Uncharacterized protein PECH_004128 [Penicillium ucsense]|uniref:T6SS Phospholipase effector Tle1-like catalytic domain-containing protein n=1 Tax=Penicillium ucsense TaxID=2839758 RepID=A0A8J8W9Z9_9EURO|nr:Uncharacterized protein PECM_005535 [Penicillium ucsense]KAF7737214.1 Uncharacterized protein PECH_004128 [Penicillium ucsense]